MTALKICPTCSTEYPANERFCPRDGTALRSQSNAVGDLVGSIIAERYHVLKKLGEGGMGQVYLAEHVKMGRQSAVKVMNPAMVNDADAIGRFNREAANASRINHPNVAGIYDFGETPDGLVYLAMEFIEGETVTDIVKANGALPPQRAAEITRQAAEGLYVAHGMGIVHRDLKPDNIMVSKDRDGFDCVKVVDFGIAKAQNSESQKVTRTGMVIGTPEYMSPEQLSGDKLGAATDQYSLALVAFNMLTGELPFPGDTAQTSMIMRLTDKPKRLIDMKADVAWPAEVQQVMDRALSREASSRYGSTREFGRALSEAVARMPVRPSGAAGTVAMEAPVVPPTVPTQAIPAPVAPAPVPAARSKAPLFIGGGVVIAAAVAGVLLFGRGTTAPASPATSPAPVASAPAPASVNTPTTNPATPVAGTPGGAPASGAASPAATIGANPALAEKIKLATQHAASESTARRALDEVNLLDGLATSAEDKVSLAMARAQAYGTLGQDANSCKAMKSVESIAQGTTHETQLREMLAICAKL